MMRQAAPGPARTRRARFFRDTEQRAGPDFIENLGAVSRALRFVAGQAYAAFGVGSAQAKFLRAIGQHGPMSQAELARRATADPTLTGRVLETLIRRGWVRRERSDEDRREYVLELSGSGKRLRKRIEKARDGIARRVLAELDLRDLKDFDRIAAKLLAAFEGEPPGPR